MSAAKHDQTGGATRPDRQGNATRSAAESGQTHGGLRPDPRGRSAVQPPRPGGATKTDEPTHHMAAAVQQSPRHRNVTKADRNSGSYISQAHDSLLKKVLKGEKYLKLYCYHYLINGFSVLVTPLQAEKLSRRREVSNVVLDFSVRTATTHTPQFLGLPKGAWFQAGGFETAGGGVTIGFIDTGIDPTHPSFADDKSDHPYPVPAHFSGVCEVTRDFPSGSCNRKLIGAHHFATSAITRGIFNSTEDYALYLP